MILAKSPLRVSLMGGGSDLPDHYLKHGGATLSMAIDKYVYVAVMYTPHKHIKISYSKQELVTDVNDIQNEIVKHALDYFAIKSNIEITSFADIPTVGTGLGGSSAFTCALVAALSEFTGDKFTAYDIAELACQIEIDMCQWNIGKQDQYASAFGGVNYIKYGQYSTLFNYMADVVQVTKIHNPLSIESNCILVPTNITRHSSDIIDTIDVFKKESALIYLADMASQSKCIHPSLTSYGDMLNTAWEIKKELSPDISSQEIDDLLSKGIHSGAVSGKLLGAGGGGYILFMTDNRAKIRKAFADRVCLDFGIAEEGTKVVYRD